MKAYITATSAISPQQTFSDQEYLQAFVVPEQDYFFALEPAYREYIDPKLSRRMARIIKMSVAAASQCLQNARLQQPDAIIVGTGLGCLQDTEKFLADMIENKEGLLSPTSFIQSTHNTIAGQIALTLACPHHNFTYVQHGHSFERALEDGLLQLQEGANTTLVGGVDEVTPTLYEILAKMDCAGKADERYPALTTTIQKPAWGEGASFFLLSSSPAKASLACMEGLHTFYRPQDVREVEEQLDSFLQHCAVSLEDIDAVMMGFNGYRQDDAWYQALYRSRFDGKLLLSFKNLCGEYFTASAFGHHLAVQVLSRQEVFSSIKLDGKAEGEIKNILFYNHCQGSYHTFTLFSGCQPL